MARSRNLWAFCLALLVELLVFHRLVLFTPDHVFPWDFRGVHIPLATFASDSFRRGEFPLWDPYTYCGAPFFANIQAALFHPPMLAAMFTASFFHPRWLPLLLEIAAVGQIWIAGIATFFLLRRMGTRDGAAWLGATVYQLGCFFASQAQHIGAVGGAAWIPVAWLCVVELRQKLRWRWMAGLSIALALTVTAGLPQVAVAAFGSALALAIILAVLRSSRRALPAFVLAGWAWALALSAVQFIPTAQLTGLSVAKYRADYLKTGGGIRPEAFYSLVWPNHSHVFDLDKFTAAGDPTFFYLYSSLLGLALAAAAVLWKPDKWCRAFAILTAGAALWMLGDSTIVGRTIFSALPAAIRIGIHPEFTLPVFALGIAVLAGLGADRVIRAPRLQVAAAVIVALDLIAAGSGRPFNVASTVTEPGITYRSIDGSPELAATLRRLTGAAVPPFRMDFAEMPFSWSSSAPLMAIPTANGCDPLAPERIIQARLAFSPGQRWGACYQVVNVASPVLGLMNVRYLVSRRTQEADLRRVTEVAGYKVFETQTVLPRFFLVSRVQPELSLAQAAQALHCADFDPANTAIVEGPPEDFRDVSPQSALSPVAVLSYRPAEIRLRTTAAAPALLVASEGWYPGWQTTIDGRPARTYAADAAFRGIKVPAGDHRVEMRFAPRILYYSAAVSLLALLAAGLPLARANRMEQPCPHSFPTPTS
jgi:hypothetical protein